VKCACRAEKEENFAHNSQHYSGGWVALASPMTLLAGSPDGSSRERARAERRTGIGGVERSTASKGLESACSRVPSYSRFRFPTPRRSHCSGDSRAGRRRSTHDWTPTETSRGSRPVRPADSLTVTQANGDGATNGRVVPAPSADAALGAPACAVCHDAAAAPTLAGDRARGPDHLYLVCDRCGQRWQPWRPRW